MDKDSIIIVLSHANNDERKKILKECLNNLDGEILLSTNYPVDFETQKMCDWVLYDNKNEILPKEDYHIYNVNFHVWYINEQGERIEVPYDFDHGYAVYSLIKNGVNFAKNINKKKIHILNYDFIIDMSEIYENDNILDSFDFVVYKFSDDPEDKRSAGSIFSGKIDSLIEFSHKFNSLSEYYSSIGYVTFENISNRLMSSITSNIYEKKYETLKERFQVDLINMINYGGKYYK
jgi:hypothetical protein